MTDFLERLSRRLQRKQAEEPTATSAEANRAGAADGESPPAIPTPRTPATQPTRLAPPSEIRPQLEPEGERSAPSPAEGEDIALVFAPNGPVARLLGDGYCPRHGQARMARLVVHALAEEQHALIEAGTGSGKSFAYLIPLIWNQSRAFVSTANKTLQNQLWEKDLPALQRIAPQPFTAALLKGRGNYVCRAKLEELNKQWTLPGLGLSFGELRERLEQVSSGDVEEMRLFGQQREAITAGRHDCLGHACDLRKECYYELARLRAEASDIVVVNHALLASNLVLDGQILQPRDVVVIDEAQEFEHYVVGALRLSLEYDQVPALANDPVVTGNADEGTRDKAVSINQQLFTFLNQTTGENGEQRWAAPLELPLAQTLGFHVNAIHGQLLKRYPPEPGAGDRNQQNTQHQRVMEWAAQLANEILILGRPVPDDQVRYCEQRERKRAQARVSLYQEPVHVAGFLREALWDATKTVICTTATLTVNGGFGYFRWQIGVPSEGVVSQIIDSPFDYPNQAILYTPHSLIPQYDKGEDAYVQKLAAEVERLIRASRGRAFVLCTSTRRANQLFELLAPRLPYPCYCQGMASRDELLDLFRNSGDGAVLFATKSFWEGVDVPGQTLSLVIIDKLPFAPYRDPVIQHRGQRIRDAGGDPFSQYMLPEAILDLKQGVGRLIRRETDRGVMAILDSRINTSRYGLQMIASLPRARRTLRFEDVEAFFGTEG
jgi:Rad3-related DNA helicase